MTEIKRLVRVTYFWILAAPFLFIWLGAALNQLALVANHDAMPVLLNDARVMMAHDTATIDGQIYLDPRHKVMSNRDHLKFLCDIIDLGSETDSPGDLLIDFGQWGWSFCPFLWGCLLCRKVYALEK